MRSEWSLQDSFKVWQCTDRKAGDFTGLKLPAVSALNTDTEKYLLCHRVDLCSVINLRKATPLITADDVSCFMMQFY